MAAFVGLLIISGCTQVGPDASSESDGAQSEANSDSTDDGSGGGEEAAESDEPSSGQTPSDGDQESTSPGGLSNSDVLELLGELPGQLAIGNGTELMVGRADGQSLLALDGGDTVIASQPTWSNGGDQLVWTSAGADAQLSKVQVFDKEGIPVGGPEVSDAAGTPIFYYQWSSDDESLLYLRNSPAGAQVEAGRLAPGGDVTPVAVGAPFFASWAPDGRSVAVHRNNFDIGVFDQFSDDVQIDDPEVTAAVAELPRTRGEFTTPAWIGSSQVLVVSDGDLVIADVDLTAGSMQVARRVVSDVESIRFVLSPDRSKVAFQQPPSQGADVVEAAIPVQSGGPTLAVLDFETGQTTVVTESPAVAWEWSPDASRLAWLEADRTGLARWQFWSTDPAVADNLPGNAEAPLLRLSRKYLSSYLPFFAQYTHSVTGWSPDSKAFASAGSADGVGGIWIHLLEVDVPAVVVAEGDFVTWGGGPTPPASGAAIT